MRLDLKKIDVAKHVTSSTNILFATASSMGLEPSWVVKNSIFVVTINGEESYIEFTKSSFNTELNAGLAKNKHYARKIIERNNLPDIPYAVADNLSQVDEFIALHNKVVVKPIRGSGSSNVHIITKASQLPQIKLSKYILEKYAPGIEMRYLILNQKVIAVHRSDYGVSVKADRHLDRLSIAREYWDEELIRLSHRTAKAFGLNFAAIDYMVMPNGEAYILEVNTAPGLKWFHYPTSGPPVDVARVFLNSLIEETTTKLDSPYYLTHA